MFQDKYVFAQLTAFLNRTQFNNFVRKYDGNRYVKYFTCYMMKEACKKRETNILNIPGKKYAFGSTTIPLCF